MTVCHYSDRSNPLFLSHYRTCDILITTGDLTYPDLSGILNETQKKPAFGVYGNHDSGQYLEELGIENLHLRRVEWNGLTLGGFQGCLRYKKGDLQFSEEEAKDFYLSFPRVDILLLHAGGKDILDDPSDDVHIGSEWIAAYIREKQPSVVFCGHQYSNDQMQVNNTQIFRTYGSRLIP
ncbi:hypothetical protein KBD71_02485, partial [Candidatus Woesebacteria bacterium]|nr:hypothetical protein [Candidatus Woesebacteria bacterium]